MRDWLPLSTCRVATGVKHVERLIVADLLHNCFHT
jgi:hypothetical protein